MSQILVRNLPPEIVDRLKSRAKRHNRSLEAEVREILQTAIAPANTPEFAEYQAQLAAGRNRYDAFKDFLQRRQERSLPQVTDSVDLLREDREALDSNRS